MHRLSLLTATFAMAASAALADVNIYSYRQPELIKPLTDAFTEKTGIKTNVVFLKKGLLERLQAE
ncbi:MAG: iron ABC transporter substrate-binding protein, partial [Pseudomonadota bacterium]